MGEIKTNALTAVAGAGGDNHKVSIEATGGGTITEFNTISGGTCYSATTFKSTVSGTAVGRADTTTHSHVTLDDTSGKEEGNTLKANGAAASLTETIKGTKTGTAILIGAETF